MPRVFFVARTRYGFPSADAPTPLRRSVGGDRLASVRHVGVGGEVRDERFTLVGRFPVGHLDGASFYGALPIR